MNRLQIVLFLCYLSCSVKGLCALVAWFARNHYIAGRSGTMEHCVCISFPRTTHVECKAKGEALERSTPRRSPDEGARKASPSATKCKHKPSEANFIAQKKQSRNKSDETGWRLCPGHTPQADAMDFGSGLPVLPISICVKQTDNTQGVEQHCSATRQKYSIGCNTGVPPADNQYSQHSELLHYRYYNLYNSTVLIVTLNRVVVVVSVQSKPNRNNDIMLWGIHGNPFF